MWTVAMRWTIRLLGVVSVSILARLLDRADFGLVAMATAASALPQVFLDLGLEIAVVREKNPQPSLYNTAWTIRFLQMACIAVLIFFTAPLVADFYGDARIEDIFRVLAFIVFIQGSENIWIVSFSKTFRFGKDFVYFSSVKFISVIVTIILAITFRSYWALVFGQLSASLIRTTISYFIVPEKPRWTLVDWRKLWAFSQWNLLRGLASYIARNSDRLILGKLASAPIVGAYTVGREVSELPAGEISSPINRVIAPSFSEMQYQPRRLASAAKKSLAALCTIVMPVSFGIGACANQIVPVLLGDKWMSTIPIIQLLALSGIFTAPQNMLTTIQTVIGHVALAVVNVWLRATIVLTVGIGASMMWGALGMAGTMLLASMAGATFTLFMTCRHLPELSFGSALATAGRPLLACLLMLPAVYAWDFSGLSNVFVLLALKAVTGAVVYAAMTFLFWRLAGCPDGLERMLLDGMHKGFGHVKGLRARILARPSSAS